ncbi:uncharacterized protein TNCT_217691 [Trichonephila clavata]|uniref:DUF7041 domain-containing protein n=1 Tax=Trichonephila clavata TaxID=2740835 RepID=A0A8X6GLK4_TRICU|nr:uncharacterized protein TNCT_217691 [Trichonephila clavata]
MKIKSDNENDSPLIDARVSIKPPPFWKPDPKIWFLQIEAQFGNTSISADQTKYDYIVSSIEAEILAQVLDILTNPPEDCEYATIKERLISIFAETLKNEKLLTDVELGNKKSSHLLYMRNLSTDKVSEPFLKPMASKATH